MKSYLLFLRGKPPCLKNSRVLISEGRGQPRIAPSAAVRAYLNAARLTIKRQFQNGFLLSCQVFVGVEIAVFGASDRLSSDLDNMYTTVQESLIGTILEDDSQVVGFLALSESAMDKAFEFARIWVYPLEKCVSAADAAAAFLQDRLKGKEV